MIASAWDCLALLADVFQGWPEPGVGVLAPVLEVYFLSLHLAASVSGKEHVIEIQSCSTWVKMTGLAGDSEKNPRLNTPLVACSHNHRGSQMHLCPLRDRLAAIGLSTHSRFLGKKNFLETWLRYNQWRGRLSMASASLLAEAEASPSDHEVGPQTYREQHNLLVHQGFDAER